MVKLVSYKDDPAFITPWSLVHFSVGLLFASLTVHRLGFYTAFGIFIIIHTFYELKDIYTYGLNSTWNSVGDELVAILGFLSLGKISPLFMTLLTLVFITSPLSSQSSTGWTLDIWNSRG